ncbi:uncharacterized protein LOC143557442 [Bidens hawaiensis]|uniref:uncharacterized protein LOC143557442 n=1 Tax=Bidens hawaiensis TaxID=980011 RepID=UPI00404B04CE
MDKKNVTECNEMFESFAQSEYVKKPRGGNSNPITSTYLSARGVHQVHLDTDLSKKLDEMIQQIVTRDQVTQKTLADHDLLIKNQQSAPLDMQRSISDIVRRLDERPLGQFSGSTQENPVAQLKAITIRSGRILGPEVRRNEVEFEDEEVMDEEIEMEVPRKVQNTALVALLVEKKPVEIRPSPVIDHSCVPYPARLKHQKYTREYGHFLDMFRQLKINLPFIEALQAPTHAEVRKVFERPVKRKDRLGEVSSIPLIGDCSAVVLNRVPEKLSDLGVFMIPCLFGSDAMSHALADLGASINLMSYSLYEKLELGELTTTRMSLSLADRSVKYPPGIIKNLLVKVDKFVFPVDFVVLDMEADEKVPIILGHPFLRTAKALIDVYDGKITLRVGDENVTYDVTRSMPLDLVGSNGLVDCDDLGEDESCENDSVYDQLVEISGLPEMIEVNEISCESEAGSVEKPASLELKVLPSHLEYAYLDEGSNLPVIVSSKLTKEEKSRLIGVLKSHRILMEDEYKPVVQPQRCLNPNMQEVVKKEVLKLMDAGMIYPISDSPWVSPAQVVPKKGGIVSGHKVLRDGIEVDHAKIDTISRLPPPKNVKAIRSFLGHAGFYRRFIKYFSKITRPMTRLLEKDVPFVFDDECLKAFTYLKEKLDMTTQQKRKFFRDVNQYVWDDPFLFKIGGDRILRRCVTKEEGWDIIKNVHEGLTGGHHGAHATAQKVFDSGFYWPTVVKDAEEFVKLYDACQRTGKLRSKWTGPYLVIEVLPYGVVELENPDNGTSWKVNGHRLKHYLGGPEESIEMEETPLDPSH